MLQLLQTNGNGRGPTDGASLPREKHEWGLLRNIRAFVGFRFIVLSQYLLFFCKCVYDFDQCLDRLSVAGDNDSELFLFRTPSPSEMEMLARRGDESLPIITASSASMPANAYCMPDCICGLGD
jgi:hypothetical protein